MVSKDHPGWKLSRDCIADTILAKKEEGVTKGFGFMRSLYDLSIRNLRDTQLAQAEEKYIEGRYLYKKKMKGFPHDVIIVVRDGCVQEVRSNNQFLNVIVADYDDDD